MKQPFFFAVALVLACGCGNSGKPDMDADARATFAAQPDSLTITLSVEPTKNPAEYRSVTFLADKNTLVGNPIMAPDGTTADPVAFMEHEEALGMIKAASAAGVFAQARKYYSVWRPAKNGPGPPAHAVSLDRAQACDERETVPPPRLAIRFVASDDYWHIYYETTLPWNGKARALMRRFANAMSEANRRPIEQMMAAMDP